MAAPTPPDVAPAAAATTAVVAGISDDQLHRPTPCGTYPVATLLAHID